MNCYLQILMLCFNQDPNLFPENKSFLGHLVSLGYLHFACSFLLEVCIYILVCFDLGKVAIAHTSSKCGGSTFHI